MYELKDFRKKNNLQQKELADFLGIGQSFLSNIESGRSPLPDDKLEKLLSNPYGWDTSLLSKGDISAQAVNHSNASVTIGARTDSALEAMRQEIEHLRTLLEEEKKRSSQYWEMIQKLMSK